MVASSSFEAVEDMVRGSFSPLPLGGVSGPAMCFAAFVMRCCFQPHHLKGVFSFRCQVSLIFPGRMRNVFPEWQSFYAAFSDSVMGFTFRGSNYPVHKW